MLNILLVSICSFFLFRSKAGDPDENNGYKSWRLKSNWKLYSNRHLSFLYRRKETQTAVQRQYVQHDLRTTNWSAATRVRAVMVRYLPMHGPKGSMYFCSGLWMVVKERGRKVS